MDPGRDSHYPNELTIANLIRIPYVPVLGSFAARGPGLDARSADVDVVMEDTDYTVPAACISNIVRQGDDEATRCRLEELALRSPRVELTFSRAKRSDFHRVSARLDELAPPRFEETLRTLLAPHVDPLARPGDSALPCLTRVGVHIVSSDGQLLRRRRAHSSAFHAGAWTFASSAPMTWREAAPQADPFADAKGAVETLYGSTLDLDSMRLVALGVDSRFLTYQLSFFLRADATGRELLARSGAWEDLLDRREQPQTLPFDARLLVQSIRDERWEPAAAAGVLELCAREAPDELEKVLSK